MGNEKFSMYGIDAETMFLNGHTLTAISNILPVSIQTLSTWKEKYEWAEKRSAHIKTAKSVQEKINVSLHREIDRVTVEGFNAKNADMLLKLAKMQEVMGGVEDMAAITILVLQEMQKYASANIDDEGKITIIYDFLQDFLSHVKKQQFG